MPFYSLPFDGEPVPSQTRYPEVAGWKTPGTSAEAAATVDASTLRRLVVEQLKSAGPQTTDECAAALGMDRLAIRPRFSELKALGQIVDSGSRRKNISQKSATVWDLVGRRD